jgi:MFS family permease
MPFVQAKAQAGNSAIQIVQAAQPQTNPIYVQMDRKPFTDNRIRLALKYAVDREAMVRQVELGFGGVGNDLLLLIWIPLLMVGIFAESSFAPSALSYLADISEEVAKDRGLLMGLYSIFLGVGQLLGNGLGGLFAKTWGFDGLIFLTVLFAFIALISLLMLFRQEKKLSYQ